MVLCKFWPQGRCKNGDRCTFEHPGNLVPRNDNRFSVLQPPENSSSSSYGRSHTNDHPTAPQHPNYNLSRDAIIADLSTERPQWILSAYTASPKAPVQLFGGPQREQSFEEMRLIHYNALATGNPSPAIQEADALVQGAELQIRNVLSNIDAAVAFVRKGDDEHPNRIDVCEFSVKNPGQPFPVVGAAPPPTVTNPSPFARGGSSGFPQPASAFGQPSAITPIPNPFGATPQNNSRFGQPASLGAFGQPSALGQKLNPFAASTTAGSRSEASSGTPTGFSAFAAQSNPFGAPSGPGPSNPFGQTSQAQPNPFNQPAQTSGASPFAQSPATGNPFGGSSSAQQNSFGSPSTGGPKNLFEITPQVAQIGQFARAAPAATPNPFAQSVPAAEPVNPNPFGQQASIAPSATINPFSQPGPAAPSSTTANPFGPAPSNSNLFGLTNTTIPSSENPFGRPQPVPTSTTSNPFNTATTAVPKSSPVTNGSGESNPYPPDSSYQHPPLRSYASLDASGTLTMFKGKPVISRRDEEGAAEAGFRKRDGSFEKIWFPGGAPPYNKDTELQDDAYTEDVKTAYKHLRETRSFSGGVMPLIPPKREYCLWDF